MMISSENSNIPNSFEFDIAICALGYESRCRFIIEKFGISAKEQICIEFGFLREASYFDNRTFFLEKNWKIMDIHDLETFVGITELVTKYSENGIVRLFIDISAMSREMMANLVLAVNKALGKASVAITVGYAPTKFSSSYDAAPIRVAAPVKPELAGWSSRPDKPLGVVVGLGCEPGLALGALQVIEPNMAWLHTPKGFDKNFDAELRKANEHISDIFDVIEFEYDIDTPSVMRGRIEALINSVQSSFRLICIPFGPKIFAWSILVTVVFGQRPNVGVWAFSSKEQAVAVDRAPSGEVVWHNMTIGEAAQS